MNVAPKPEPLKVFMAEVKENLNLSLSLSLSQLVILTVLTNLALKPLQALIAEEEEIGLCLCLYWLSSQSS